jgi:hypothetical protein
MKRSHGGFILRVIATPDEKLFLRRGKTANGKPLRAHPTKFNRQAARAPKSTARPSARAEAAEAREEIKPRERDTIE